MHNESQPPYEGPNGVNGFNGANGFNGINGVNGGDGTKPLNGPHSNGTAVDSNRPHPTDVSVGHRGRGGHHGYKNGHYTNGHKIDKRPFAPKPQRVPSADEFPVLAGACTPPSRSPGLNGHMNGLPGLTAAQVLLAPAPARKEKDSEPGTRRGSPDATKETEPLVNGNTTPVTSDETLAPKVSLSFAAAAAAPDNVPKDIPVAA